MAPNHRVQKSKPSKKSEASVRGTRKTKRREPTVINKAAIVDQPDIIISQATDINDPTTIIAEASAIIARATILNDQATVVAQAAVITQAAAILNQAATASGQAADTWNPSSTSSHPSSQDNLNPKHSVASDAQPDSTKDQHPGLPHHQCQTAAQNPPATLPQLEKPPCHCYDLLSVEEYRTVLQERPDLSAIESIAKSNTSLYACHASELKLLLKALRIRVKVQNSAKENIAIVRSALASFRLKDTHALKAFQELSCKGKDQPYWWWFTASTGMLSQLNGGNIEWPLGYLKWPRKDESTVHLDHPEQPMLAISWKRSSPMTDFYGFLSKQGPLRNTSNTVEGATYELDEVGVSSVKALFPELGEISHVNSLWTQYEARGGFSTPHGRPFSSSSVY